MRSDIIDVSVQFQHKTEKAICVRETEDGEDIWFPLSQIEVDADINDLRRGEIVEISGPEDLIMDKGLI